MCDVLIYFFFFWYIEEVGFIKITSIFRHSPKKKKQQQP